jgi:hypothetical protein
MLDSISDRTSDRSCDRSPESKCSLIEVVYNQLCLLVLAVIAVVVARAYNCQTSRRRDEKEMLIIVCLFKSELDVYREKKGDLVTISPPGTCPAEPIQATE